MFNKSLLKTVAALGAAAIAACSGDSSSPAAPPPPTIYANPVGTYDVSSVNAKALPVAIFSDTAYKYEVVSGTMSLGADGKYWTKMTFRQTVAGKVDLFVDSTGGTWTQNGTLVFLTNAQDQSGDQANWVNTGSLTFVEAQGTASNTYVYLIKPAAGK